MTVSLQTVHLVVEFHSWCVEHFNYEQTISLPSPPYMTHLEEFVLIFVQVELLVMKALSVGLIKGNIDEVDKKVQMTWVQPRVLDLQQVRLALLHRVLFLLLFLLINFVGFSNPCIAYLLVDPIYLSHSPQFRSKVWRSVWTSGAETWRTWPCSWNNKPMTFSPKTCWNNANFPLWPVKTVFCCFFLDCILSVTVTFQN